MKRIIKLFTPFLLFVFSAVNSPAQDYELIYTSHDQAMIPATWPDAVTITFPTGGTWFSVCKDVVGMPSDTALIVAKKLLEMELYKYPQAKWSYTLPSKKELFPELYQPALQVGNLGDIGSIGMYEQAVEQDGIRLANTAQSARFLAPAAGQSGRTYQSANPVNGSVSVYHLEAAQQPYRLNALGNAYYTPNVTLLGEQADQRLWDTFTFVANDTVTVIMIAEAYRIPVQMLLEINGIRDATLIQAGATIWIPALYPKARLAVFMPMGFYPGFVERMFGCSKAQQLLDLAQPGDMTKYSNIPTNSAYGILSPWMSEWQIEVYLHWHRIKVDGMTPPQALAFTSNLDKPQTLQSMRADLQQMEQLYGSRFSPVYAMDEYGHLHGFSYR